MARGPRIAFPNAVYHVINRFVDKHPFFVHDDDYADFLEVFFDVAQGLGVIPYAYSLMPNHFHFCIETPDANVSEFLQRFLTRACVRMNRKIDRTGHLLQARTKTLLVDDACYFKTVIAYVLLNSVRAGMGSNPLTYRWSSAAEMLVPGAYCRIDRERLLKKLMGRVRLESDEGTCCEQLATWLSKICRIENERVFHENHRGSFLGSEEYRHRILDRFERRLEQEGNRARRRPLLTVSLDWRALKTALDENLSPDDIVAGGWASAETATTQMRIYIAHHMAGWKYDRIQTESGDAHRLSAYAMVVGRIRGSEVRRSITERIASVIL